MCIKNNSLNILKIYLNMGVCKCFNEHINKTPLCSADTLRFLLDNYMRYIDKNKLLNTIVKNENFELLNLVALDYKFRMRNFENLLICKSSPMMVKTLIEFGLNISPLDLNYIIANEKIEILKLFLKKIDYISDFITDATIKIAVKFDDPELLIILNNYSPTEAIKLAAEKNSTKIINYILSNKPISLTHLL